MKATRAELGPTELSRPSFEAERGWVVIQLVKYKARRLRSVDVRISLFAMQASCGTSAVATTLAQAAPVVGPEARSVPASCDIYEANRKMTIG